MLLLLTLLTFKQSLHILRAGMDNFFEIDPPTSSSNCSQLNKEAAEQIHSSTCQSGLISPFLSISSRKIAMYKHGYFDRKTRNCIGCVSEQSLHYTLKALWALDISTKLFCSFKSWNNPLGSKNSRTMFSYTQWEAAVFCVKFCRSHNQRHQMKIPTSKT